MVSQKILSVFLISTLAACASGSGDDGLSTRTPEQRCLELEHKWDKAQQELSSAEEREDSSWLYHMADTFNPLTNSSDESLNRARSNELRARENYVGFGCLDLNKNQINSAINSGVVGQPAVGAAPMSYQVPNQR